MLCYGTNCCTCSTCFTIRYVEEYVAGSSTRKNLPCHIIFAHLFNSQCTIQFFGCCPSIAGILTKSRVIMWHYVCSVYFLLDVAAVVPLEVLGLAWDSEERFSYIAIFRLNRLIKIWKVCTKCTAYPFALSHIIITHKILYFAVITVMLSMFVFFFAGLPNFCHSLTPTHQVISFFNQMEGSLYLSVAYARLLKFTFYILAATHFSACLWFPLACYSEKK